MARYLITGGCGFIGSHLTDALLFQGHDVVILDDLSTGKRTNVPPKVQVIVGDATDYPTVESAFTGIDGCFHLAAIASVEKSQLEWARSHTVNSTATVNVLQAASRSQPKIPVVYASSAAVYGDSHYAPVTEDDPTLPLTAYGVDKLGSEWHARVGWRVHGVPSIGLRPFNVYGPRQDPSSPYSGVISIFTRHILYGLPIAIFGDGEQIRDFVYVGDAVKSFIAAMHRATEGADVVNVCTGKPTTINHLAHIIEELCGFAAKKQYLPARVGDIRSSVGSTRKHCALLGNNVTTSLLDGLRMTLGAYPKRESMAA